MSTTVAGIRFSDQLGALLDHAVAHGFRVEKDERGKNAKGVVVYAPDVDHRPITIDERNARFNRAHYDNVRRDLYRAGLPPLPGESAKNTVAAEPADGAVPPAFLADAPPGSRPLKLGTGFGIVETPELADLLDNRETKSVTVGKIAGSLAERVGVGTAEAALVSSLLEVFIDWAEIFSADRMAEVKDDIVNGIVATHKRELKAATDLAEEAEARAVAAEKAREKAEARGAETGRMLTEALAAKTAAEEEAKRLRDALAPLRALMTATDA